TRPLTPSGRRHAGATKQERNAQPVVTNRVIWVFNVHKPAERPNDPRGGKPKPAAERGLEETTTEVSRRWLTEVAGTLRAERESTARSRSSTAHRPRQPHRSPQRSSTTHACGKTRRVARSAADRPRAGCESSPRCRRRAVKARRRPACRPRARRAKRNRC